MNTITEIASQNIPIIAAATFVMFAVVWFVGKKKRRQKQVNKAMKRHGIEEYYSRFN